MKERFYSLDVFRGATVCLMILVNNPGSWKYIYSPFEHAPWHGCTPTDLVFPFFLFAVGNALSFVMPGLEQKGTSAALQKILKRSFLIFLIGLLLNWFPFVKWSDGHLVGKSFESLRILGVLQRIALAYLFAALLLYFLKPKKALVAGVIILLLYWWFVKFFGDSLDPYSMNGYIGTRIDKFILGENHMYHGEGVAFDPEGLLSTIPAIVQIIFGFMAGDYIQKKGRNFEMISNLFVAGCIFTAIGLVWDLEFPINKKIWTSSYVFYTTGLAILIISVMIFLIEMKNRKGWLSKFFDVFGKNPLFIFALSAVWVKTYALIRPDGVRGFYSWFYETVFVPIGGHMNGSLLFALFHITLFWFLAWILDKNRIYIKV